MSVMSELQAELEIEARIAARMAWARLFYTGARRFNPALAGSPRSTWRWAWHEARCAVRIV